MHQEEIGKRLAILRKQRGYSQEELAKLIDLTRSSLAQIETGNRQVSAEEIWKFAQALEFSIDQFLSPNFKATTERIKETRHKAKAQERIAVPKLNVEKFKQVLLYILEKCAGKPNVGETVLYKLLYFSEFNYYEVYEEHLIGATFKKLPYGPVPQRLDTILNKMQSAGQLQLVKTNYFDRVQKRYIPLVKPDLALLKASETETIDQVLYRFSDYSATAISEAAHNDMPWKATAEGDVIDYELVFYREGLYRGRGCD